MTSQSSKSPAFSGSELSAMEAHEVAALLKKGEVSSAELLAISRERAEVVEPAINAMPTTCWERADDASKTLEKYDGSGTLYGLPLNIKDLTSVKGVLTTNGTKGLANNVPGFSYPLVERIEERGGVVIGKTNTPEYGAGGNTFNDVFGPTFNPWNTSLNAGGSSGGAAASLATGEVWLSHGSDHGGSLRTPAAFCGIVGLRPSPGRAGGSTLDQAFMIEGAQGPMARSVTDCALFLDTMSGFEPRFPISYPAPEVSYFDAVQKPNDKPRIGFSMDLNGFGAVDKEMADHLQAALAMLEKNGASVEEVSPDTSKLEDTYHTLRGMMWATEDNLWTDDITRHFKQTLKENTKFGNALTMEDIGLAQINRSRMYAEMLSIFEKIDVLALPVVGCMPHPQSVEYVKEIGGQKLDGYMDWLRFAFLATVTNLPAMSVPVGLGPRGLPVGMQLIGKPRDEAGMLQVARFIEMTMGGPLGPIDPILTS